ncbi:WD repeat-containing protein 88 [Fusarium irregulare]|uniref:WD repeat-containing protein 88 n=1 Tax=Fusarium irregulare TaxID=2494466 RepID=A0A9W8Q2E5_9HYPO|nr:WD repeat-containing protein 88 [Fusarium irregulare]
MKPTEEILQGAIYNATQTCRTSLSDCIQFETLMKNEWAENRLADFNLWASGVGASVKGKASLDARLATRPDARDVVANLLQVLTGAIEECKALVGGSAEASHTGDDGHSSSDQEEDPPRSLSPWSDDTESDPDLEAGLEDSSSPLGKAKETVNSILDLLVRIAITIRRSGTQSRLRKADRKFKIEDHEDLQRHLVVVMLSQGPFSSDYTFSTERTDASKITPIQWRLINCNLKRRNRFLYAQKHSDALDTPSSSTVPSSETPKPEIQDLPARPLGSTPVQKPSTKSVAMATSASGITDLPAVLPALPKGPVSSHATRTNLSTTVIKLPYPHPPKVDEDAMVFSCPCCCQTLPVAMLEMSRWKKHLAEDIQPYTCVLPGCPSPETLYVTKKEWDLHLREDHGSTDMWTCFACLDSLQLETEADFVAHTVQEHSETISQGQIHALAAACKKSITAEITSCPLCAWPTLEEGEVSQIAVLDHIAEHVHAFSLRALPWAPDAVHETEAAVEKAATKVEPWLTKRNFTSKTLTVIESSTTAPAPPLPPTHYFETHDYFAEDSDNSSRSTVSDGTIERELREEPPLLFEDSNNEVDIAEPNDEADESREEDEDSDNGDDTDSDNFVSENVFKLPEESEKESSGYVSRYSFPLPVLIKSTVV